MTGRAIESLLAEKHAADVFVRQCKNGPTGTGLGVMDAWVMAKSWAHPSVIVYEIKTSRQDFLKDQKWPNYLPYCNLFYFVCQWKLIDPSEVGSSAGLLYASNNLSRLYIKKKAPYREVTAPESVFRYILMARAKIDVERNHAGIDYWRDWLAQTREEKKIGRQVSREIRKLAGVRIEEAREELRRMQERLESYQAVQEILREVGIDPEGYDCSGELRSKLNGDSVRYSLKRISETMRRTLDQVDALMAKQKAK